MTALGFLILLSIPTAADAAPSGCNKTAKLLLNACKKEAFSDYFVALANARNLADGESRREAKMEAREELREALGECKDQKNARLDLCEELEEDIYDPFIDPAQFTLPGFNPLFPLVPGTILTYEKVTSEGTENVVVQVLTETKEILGVTCVIVQDTEFLDGEVVEDTFDYYAQHVDGTVWYFGENSLEFEGDEVVSVAGSWKAGVDGAKPGPIMLANPMIGDVYRQEAFYSEAEDAARVVDLGLTVTVPFGTFSNCIQTQDFSPLEPDALENKFYAPGIGLILESDPEDLGADLELIDVMVP